MINILVVSPDIARNTNARHLERRRVFGEACWKVMTPERHHAENLRGCIPQLVIIDSSVWTGDPEYREFFEVLDGVSGRHPNFMRIEL